MGQYDTQGEARLLDLEQQKSMLLLQPEKAAFVLQETETFTVDKTGQNTWKRLLGLSPEGRDAALEGLALQRYSVAAGDGPTYGPRRRRLA